MRNQIILTFLISALISCSPDNDIKSDHEIEGEQCPEKWQLTMMTGNIANVPPSTGSDMEWQEWYVLYPNDTFTKTRERDNVITEENGTYAMVSLSDGEYFELTYDSDNDIIGNCVIEAVEVLTINSEDELVSTWQACDGPGLFYKKVEFNCDEP